MDSSKIEIRYKNRRFSSHGIWTARATYVSWILILSSLTLLPNTLAQQKDQQLCGDGALRFLDPEGKQSSITFELNGGSVSKDNQNSCTIGLRTLQNYGFMVRLIPMVQRDNYDDKLIETRKCPLSIIDGVAPNLSSWEIDPCQQEDGAIEIKQHETKLFNGLIRIYWDHKSQVLNSKLIVTVLGKGKECRRANKHPCLKNNDEPIICISKELICDGIRHCPYGRKFNSDEDDDLCRRTNTMAKAFRAIKLMVLFAQYSTGTVILFLVAFRL